MPATKKHDKADTTFRQGVGIHFRGSIAARRVLLSYGMHATKVEMYRGLKECWQADTERGRRWVRHTEGGWRISKVAPLGEKVCA